MAHYVIATKIGFEVPAISQVGEISSMLHPGYGWVEPYGAYQPALLDPPAGSDVLDSWQIYYRMAQKLGLKLNCGAARPMDMEHEPSTDDIYEYICAGSAVALSEVKKYPNGHIFDAARETVGPRDPGCADRLELASVAMLDELATVQMEDIASRRKTNDDFPFLLIPRRMQNVTNAAYRPTPTLFKNRYNPAFMNPADLERLGIKNGDLVEIRSRHGMVRGIVEADRGLRSGVVSLTHGFGRNPGEPSDPRRDGANVNALTRMDDDYDPYTGMPRMGALPISVAPVSATSCPAVPASESA
jgi:anaerobic selenocysteine-containing dehydrogenase